MRKIKQAFKTVFIFMFGGLLQNKDNNYSIQNQEENIDLTNEFYFYRNILLSKNKNRTVNMLMKYIEKTYAKQGFMAISKSQLAKKTAKMYMNYEKAGFIDENGRLLKAVDECITDFIS